MTDLQDSAPDSTAARVALWRALHVAVDPPPHVLEDEIGLQLLAPGPDWRHRGDMDPRFTQPFRASIVARARFIDDLVVEQASRGPTTSSSAPALTASPSGGRRSRPAFSRSTSRALRYGSAGV